MEEKEEKKSSLVDEFAVINGPPWLEKASGYFVLLSIGGMCAGLVALVFLNAQELCRSKPGQNGPSLSTPAISPTATQRTSTLHLTPQ